MRSEGFFESVRSTARRALPSSASRESYGWAFVIAVPRARSATASGARCWRSRSARSRCWRSRWRRALGRARHRAARLCAAVGGAQARAGEVVETESTGAIEFDEVSARWPRRAGRSRDRGSTWRTGSPPRCARPEGRARAAVAEPAPGGARPADRRRRARLQQPAGGDRQQRLRAAAGDAGPDTSAQLAAISRRSGRQPAHRPPAALRPAQRDQARGDRPRQHLPRLPRC